MSNAAFVQEALSHVASPEVLVNVVSRRVRQLGQGARPLVEVHPRWTLMEIALREIADQKLTYELIDPKATAGTEAEESAAVA
ncbi:MAG TPA: DNA-directed RNA polymerase subunit omega [Candidatus Methylacidiphilales bacterium]